MIEPQQVHEEYLADDFAVLVLTNYLYGNPLYAFYVIEVEAFAPGDIEGVLMTPPFEFYGPFADYAEASRMYRELQVGHK